MKDLGSFTLLASGERFYIDHPELSNYTLPDMAIGIARQCRFNGQFARYRDEMYSVAQHSVLVDDLVRTIIGDEESRPWAILHDAPEGIIGDVITPVKRHCPPFYEIEARLEEDMIRRFVVPISDRIRDIVRWADLTACAMEAEELAGMSAENWGLSRPPVSIRDIYPDFRIWGVAEAFDNYTDRVYEIMGKL